MVSPDINDLINITIRVLYLDVSAPIGTLLGTDPEGLGLGFP